ncbi:MAG TPA: enoyl-CoA hydratase-related protein [Vicinamibacterales bacterium]|nr:enoyl-CoA hydratase-related protein [Vicinamibacterales bacterium]
MELSGAALVRVPAALDAARVAELSDAVACASTDARSSVVLLRGADGTVFCRGVDFAAAAGGGDVSAAIEQFDRTLAAIRHCSKPVICIVEGEAAGGGVGVAAAADVVVATPNASFALPELLFGLAPAIVLPYLAERMSIQKLRWLALTSERIDAATAAHLGLVDRVELPEHGDAVVAAWIARLRRLRPGAIADWKRMTARAPSIGSAEGRQATIAALGDPQVSGRLRRFADGGEPPWSTERR